MENAGDVFCHGIAKELNGILPFLCDFIGEEFAGPPKITVGKAGSHTRTIRRDIDAFYQGAGDLIVLEQLTANALASGNDGGKQLIDARRSQEEECLCRGFFQNFQQCIGCGCIHFFRFTNDENFLSRLERAHGRFTADFPDRIDGDECGPWYNDLVIGIDCLRRHFGADCIDNIRRDVFLWLAGIVVGF